MPYDEELAARIRELIPDEVEYTEKKMFGGLAFLIGGNMSIAASGKGDLLARFDPAKTEEYEGDPHVNPFVMREREMDGWLRVEPAGLESDAELAKWVERGVSYARSLPPK